MSKILCVPVVNDDGWNAAITSSLAEAALWALVDESEEVGFVENPMRGQPFEVDRLVASIWMLGAVGVVAPEADVDLQEKFVRMGIVVVALPRAVTVRQVRGPWLALELPEFANQDSEAGSRNGGDSEG
ncbi:MAG: hypothetical protein IPN71_02735 [Fibrobacteres bacterium]|nr:hypothetical protein [Fibrobacterota bacterium]